MASSSGQPSADSASDLTTLISKGTVNEEGLQQYAEKGLLDIPDKDGRTPLMIACLKGLEDTVKFLLANGANPNSKCLKEGNTPMHYACLIVRVTKDNALYQLYDDIAQWNTPKIAIIKLLLDSGALAIQDNLNGWSPPCVAAFSMLKDVVDFFLAMDDAEIPLEEKIKAAEILGASLATLDYDSLCDGSFESFSQAISFRQGGSLPKAQSKPSELAVCFSKLSLYECHTKEELESIKESNVALKAHAFIVGERLFPNDLKHSYLYPSLSKFGCDVIWQEDMFEGGNQILSCAIGFEREGKLKLGSVLNDLSARSVLFSHCEDEQLMHQHLRYLKDLLSKYESVLKQVHIDTLSDHSYSLIDGLGEILFNEAFYFSVGTKSTLLAIEKLVRIIRGRIRKENPDKYHELLSLTWKVMYLLAESSVCELGSVMHTRSLLRVKFVIHRILYFDSASYLDRMSGETILHLVAYSVSVLPSLKYLEDLASLFVRHGCPIDIVNKEGHTAKDIYEERQKYLCCSCHHYQQSDPIFLTLVSPPTAVLTLAEIAIRAILRHNVTYQELLPPNLCEIIEGGPKDSDLVLCNGEDLGSADKE